MFDSNTAKMRGLNLNAIYQSIVSAMIVMQFLQVSIREKNMSKTALLTLALALSGTMMFADAALAAKKKLTYEQAWARCKTHVDKIMKSHESQRYQAGASCMKRFGYNI